MTKTPAPTTPEPCVCTCPKPNPFKALLYSRKFWLAVVAVAQTVVLHYLKVEPDVWQAIDLLIGIVIAGIAAEDAAAKA